MMKAQKVRDLDEHGIAAPVARNGRADVPSAFQMSMGQMEGLKKVRAMKKDRRGC